MTQTYKESQTVVKMTNTITLSIMQDIILWYLREFNRVPFQFYKTSSQVTEELVDQANEFNLITDSTQIEE